MRSCNKLCLEMDIVKVSKGVYKTKDVCRVCQCGFNKNIFTRCPCCSHNLSTKPRHSRLKLPYIKFFNKPIKINKEKRTHCLICNKELNLNPRAPKTIQKYCKDCYEINNRINAKNRYYKNKLRLQIVAC